MDELQIILIESRMYQVSEKIILQNNVIKLWTLLGISENIVKNYGEHSPLYEAYYGIFSKDVMVNIFTEYLSSIKDIDLIEDREGAIEKLFMIMGLGIGLTPSGDDFLAGMCLVLANYDEYLIPLLQIKQNESVNETNIISKKMIENAIKNKARLSEKKLINAFFCQDKKEIKKFTHQVLKIGSSSGTDVMCGIMVGIQTIINDQKNIEMLDEIFVKKASE